MTSQHDVMNKTTVSNVQLMDLQSFNSFGFQLSLCAYWE